MITDEILGGEFDQILDDIQRAVEDRREILAKRLAAELEVGDRVRFNQHTSPKYLIGVMATVAGKEGTMIDISLDRGIRRYSAGAPIKCPAFILERV